VNSTKWNLLQLTVKLSDDSMNEFHTRRPSSG